MRSNIIQGIHSLRQAFEFFSDFQRSHPKTKGAALFSGYNKKIDWIYKDLVSHPLFSEEIRNGIKEEWESDIFSVNAIADKVGLLRPEKREMIEEVIDAIIKGEEVVIKDIKEVNY